MTRTQQTIAIVAAMFAILASYMAFDRVTNPNLDGLHPYARCDYWAYWHNHGGSMDQCKVEEAKAAGDRLASGMTGAQGDMDSQVLKLEAERDLVKIQQLKKGPLTKEQAATLAQQEAGFRKIISNYDQTHDADGSFNEAAFMNTVDPSATPPVAPTKF